MALGLSAADVMEAFACLLIIAIFFPIAIGYIMNASMAGLSPTVVTVFQVLLPLLAIIGTSMYFVPRRGNTD